MTRALVIMPLAAITLAGCSRTELDLLCDDAFGQRAQPICEHAMADPPEMILPEENALRVLSAGCDIVALLATTPSPTLRVSLDGGMTFGAAQTLPPDALPPNLSWPRDEPLAMAQDGTLHVFAESTAGLRLHHSNDFGATWSPPVDIPESDNFWSASIVVRGEEVNASWLEFPDAFPWTAWLARSRDGGHSFEPPVRVARSQSQRHHSPALCAAGKHGMVGGWLDCTGTDCSGDDRNGTALGMIAISEGGRFSNHELFRLDNGVHSPVAGCFADGRAVVTWSAAPYLGSANDIVVAAILPCGITRETARFKGGRSSFFSPLSPTPVLGPNGALLFWHLEFNLGSGIAAVDSAGALISTSLDPDFDADGAPDVPLDACAFPTGGYALLTAGSDFLGDEPMRAVATLLTDDGTPAQVRVLGPLAKGTGGVRCDGSGRAHFFWTGDDHARYAAIRAKF